RAPFPDRRGAPARRRRAAHPRERSRPGTIPRPLGRRPQPGALSRLDPARRRQDADRLGRTRVARRDRAHDPQNSLHCWRRPVKLVRNVSITMFTSFASTGAAAVAAMMVANVLGAKGAGTFALARVVPTVVAGLLG